MAVTTVAALRELVGSVEAQLGPVRAPLGIVLGYVVLAERETGISLGFGLVAQRAENEVVNGLLIALDQLGESHAISALNAKHQRGIRVGGGGHGASVANTGGLEKFRCGTPQRGAGI